MRCIRVVIADRRPVILQGLSSVLEANRDFRVVAHCSDGTSCLEAIRTLLPDIAVLGMPMPDMSGLKILAIANSENLPTRLVFFTASEGCDRQMLAAAGAQTVVPNDVNPEMLVQTLRDVPDGRTLEPMMPSDEIVSAEQSVIAEKSENSITALTDRQRQIMRLVSEGMSNKEIGRQLKLTGGTIKVHLHRIFQKLEVGNRTALAARALSQNEDAARQRYTGASNKSRRSRLQGGGGRRSNLEI